MKSLKVTLALAVAAQLLVATAQAENAGASVKAAPDAKRFETINMPLEAFTIHFWSGLEYANQKAVEPTTTFLTDGLFWIMDGSMETTSAVINGVAKTYHGAVQLVVAIPDIPTKAGRTLLGNMQGDDLHKFLDMVYHTGFSLADVELTASLLPHLSIYFEHERDLSEEEREEVMHKINAYIKEESNYAGYLEAVVLRTLVRAGKYSGEIDLKGAHIEVLPLPGLTLSFDPVRVTHRNKLRAEKSSQNASRALEEIAQLSKRLQRIEAEILGELEDELPENEMQSTGTD